MDLAKEGIYTSKTMWLFEVPTRFFRLRGTHCRYKKARQVFTLRAFRTSSQALVTGDKEFGWRELNTSPKFLHS